MDKESLKILAMAECLILWDYLAETGEPHKQTAIEVLYSQSKLCRESYSLFGCPFCFYLRRWGKNPECASCLWPGSTGIGARCGMDGTLYSNWQTAGNKKLAAKKVLDMLLQIPMD